MAKAYHHVTQDIRSQIYALKAIGTSLHKISAIVGRQARCLRFAGWVTPSTTQDSLMTAG